MGKQKPRRKPVENLMEKCLWKLLVKRQRFAIFSYALISKRRVACLRWKTQLKMKKKRGRGREREREREEISAVC